MRHMKLVLALAAILLAYTAQAIVIGWNANPEAGINSYRVYKLDESGGKFLIGETSQTTLALDLIVGERIVVTASNEVEGNPSQPFLITADSGAPESRGVRKEVVAEYSFDMVNWHRFAAREVDTGDTPRLFIRAGVSDVQD